MLIAEPTSNSLRVNVALWHEADELAEARDVSF
jgi:hypothetical protein